MHKIEQIHQRIRTALLCGYAVSKKDRQQAFKAISDIDTKIESSLLMLESHCAGRDDELDNLVKQKVGQLLTQHMILSDLTFWLKNQIQQGGAHD